MYARVQNIASSRVLVNEDSVSEEATRLSRQHLYVGAVGGGGGGRATGERNSILGVWEMYVGSTHG